MTEERKRIIIQFFLFIITFITTTLAGCEWAYGKVIIVENWRWNDSFTWSDFSNGMRFSVPLLFILTVHEFGHYFTAMAHKIKASLPYFIPFPSIIIPSIGTLGAIIRIRSRVHSNIQHFDIGLAGPLAGFIVALVVVFYGFQTLPPPEYIYQFHPEYEKFGPDYADVVYTEEYIQKQERGGMDIEFGNNMVFWFFSKFVADPERVPNPHELMHYPILMAGFLALFFTSLNLLPIGQLDGGHVVYGLFGRKGHEIIATTFFVLLLFYSGLGYINIRTERELLSYVLPMGILFYYLCLSGLKKSFTETLMYALLILAAQFLIAWIFPGIEGYSGWLLFAFLIGRVLGVQHPPTEVEQPLDSKRQVLGWIGLFIFVVSFSPAPIQLKVILPVEETTPVKENTNAAQLFF